MTQQIEAVVPAATASPSATPRRGRDLRIDAARGLVLVMIFLDHTLGNPWNLWTLRRVGLLTALDVFVLLSGVSGYLAYGVRMRPGGDGLRRLWHRVLVVYAAYLALVVALVGLAALARGRLSGTHVDRYLHVGDWFEEPLRAVVSTLTMTDPPRLAQILPLYVLLLPTLPVLVWLLRGSAAERAAGAAGVALIALWGAVLGPADGWDLDVRVMLLIYAAGVVLGAASVATAHPAPHRTWAGAGPRDRMLTILAVAFLLGVLVADAPWVELGWSTWQPVAAPGTLPGTGLLRLVNLAALVWLVVRWVPRDARWLRHESVAPLTMLGRHSLPVFWFGAVCAALGTLLANHLGGSLLLYGLVSVAGVAIMLAVAASWPTVLRLTPRPAVLRLAPRPREPERVAGCGR